MPIDRIPDWEERLARQDAFWDCQVMDRPVVIITLPRVPLCAQAPTRSHPTLRDRWFDATFQAECASAWVKNTEYLGDALPFAWPNLGPEVLAACFGCELEFGEDTSWSIPCLMEWHDARSFAFSEGNPYWRKIEDLGAALLDAGRGTFYTGLTDWQANSELLASLRDPLQLNLDLVDSLEEVRELLPVYNARWNWVVNRDIDRLIANGQAITSWPGIISARRWYVAQSDFSCMISKAMFDDVFLPGVLEQIRSTDCCIYHLDGPGALRHLDSLLAIPELKAIQWVPGAGKGRTTDWLEVYRRIQAAGKAIQMWVDLDEIEIVLEALKPEGVWVSINGVPDRETGTAIIKRVAAWTTDH
jgi:hypothetical protein